MPRLSISCPPSIDAHAIGSVLAGSLRTSRTSALASEGALFIAPVVSEAYVLGAFQRAASTLDLARPEITDQALARRTTGGVALHVRTGQIFLALDLASASVLGGNGDPSRAINRHVRPMLSALASLGVPATYGGRDFVLAGASPVAFIGVTHDRVLGSVAIEAIVAVDAPFGIDPTLDLAHGSIAPRWLGKTPGTLVTRAHRSLDQASIIDALVAAWSSLAEGDTSMCEAPPSSSLLASRDLPPFSALVEEGMGLIGAVREASTVALGGELMVSRGALEALGIALHALGDSPDDRRLEATIDAALGPSSHTMLFGVKSLSSIAKVVRAALAR